jgi:hypothetical protein
MRPAQFGVDLGWVVDPALGSIICGQIVAFRMQWPELEDIWDQIDLVW